MYGCFWLASKRRITHMHRDFLMSAKVIIPRRKNQQENETVRHQAGMPVTEPVVKPNGKTNQ